MLTTSWVDIIGSSVLGSPTIATLITSAWAGAANAVPISRAPTNGRRINPWTIISSLIMIYISLLDNNTGHFGRVSSEPAIARRCQSSLCTGCPTWYGARQFFRIRCREAVRPFVLSAGRMEGPGNEQIALWLGDRRGRRADH